MEIEVRSHNGTFLGRVIVDTQATLKDLKFSLYKKCTSFVIRVII